MNVRPTSLPDVLAIEPRRHGDARGVFFEGWHAERYAAAGIPGPFVQDNVSWSAAGVLRGLHLQEPTAQGKLVQVLHGAVWDVAVDVRVGSPTFGRWVAERLTAENGRQLWIPAGFAHGFVVLDGPALVTYKCTAHHCGAHELTVRWDDPDLAIAWPLVPTTLSPRDADAPRLRDIPPARLPHHG